MSLIEGLIPQRIDKSRTELVVVLWDENKNIGLLKALKWWWKHKCPDMSLVWKAKYFQTEFVVSLPWQVYSLLEINNMIAKVLLCLRSRASQMTQISFYLTCEDIYLFSSVY